MKILGKYIEPRRYGEGERPGKSLANLLKKPWATNVITCLHEEKDNVSLDAGEILKSFHSDFTNVYQSKQNHAMTQLTDYLTNIARTWMDDPRHEYLSQPFTKEEIITVVKSPPSSKVPGPDGLPTEFYKEYTEILAPTC